MKLLFFGHLFIGDFNIFIKKSFELFLYVTRGGFTIEFSEMRGPNKIFGSFISQNEPNILFGPLISEKGFEQ